MMRAALLGAGLLAACATPPESSQSQPARSAAHPSTMASGTFANPADLGGLVMVSASAKVKDAMLLARVHPGGFERCFAAKRVGGVDVVSVEFDVTRDGQVANLRVLSATDSCFEVATIRAILRWRYAPKTVDGEAVPRRGVLTSIRYEMG